MEKPKVDFYFTGAAFWAEFEAQRAEYPGDDAQLNVLTDGKKGYVQICGAPGEVTTEDGGGPINDSHPCPGSPGCPT